MYFYIPDRILTDSAQHLLFNDHRWTEPESELDRERRARNGGELLLPSRLHSWWPPHGSNWSQANDDAWICLMGKYRAILQVDVSLTLASPYLASSSAVPWDRSVPSFRYSLSCTGSLIAWERWAQVVSSRCHNHGRSQPANVQTVATFLCGAESFPTPIRGHFLGLAAAFGKAGAAIGTQVFKPIQNSFANPDVQGTQAVFLVSRATHGRKPSGAVLADISFRVSDRCSFRSCWRHH